VEASLTDMKCGFIIREEILPSFKSGDYFGGIKRGVLAATGIVAGSTDIYAEELARYQRDTTSTGSRSSSGGVSFNFLFFILFLLFTGIGRRGFGRRGGLFRALFWGSLLSNSSHRGGGFSGGGGGGFGGFSGGGGSFGGGGASGGW